jgi:hypothetical protein
MSQATHTLTPYDLRTAAALREREFSIRDIAMLLHHDPKLIRLALKGQRRPVQRLARCSGCGRRVAIPCLECAMESRKQINRAARFLVSTQG